MIISSEYTANRTGSGGGRQINTTLITSPHRLLVLGAKVLSLVALVLVTTVLVIASTVTVAVTASGEAIGADTWPDLFWQSAGASVYWTLMSLIALAITVLARSGLVPLIVLIADSSLISVSMLLSRVTSLAYYLPDIAGQRLFGPTQPGMFDGDLDPIPGRWRSGRDRLGSVHTDRYHRSGGANRGVRPRSDRFSSVC
ncbi:MAG: hypothetical protein ACK5H2_11580 [Beutenbergiaceae bacterium]